VPKANHWFFTRWGGMITALNAVSGDTQLPGIGISPIFRASADRHGTMYCLRAFWDKASVRDGPLPRERDDPYTQTLQKKPASRKPIFFTWFSMKTAHRVFHYQTGPRKLVITPGRFNLRRYNWNYQFPRNIVATPD
jgi:hypothetical protein